MTESAPKRKRTRAHRVDLDESLCKGCGICVDVCRAKVFDVGGGLSPRGLPVVIAARPKDCTGCLQCEYLCPDMAIAVTEEEGEEGEGEVPPAKPSGSKDAKGGGA